MARRGLTLVEVLAALALLVLLSALAMPALSGRLEESRFEAGKRQVEAAVMVCRAEALRQGRALRLVVRPMGRGEFGLFMERVSAGEALAAAGREVQDSPGGGEESGVAPEDERGDLPTPVWSVLPGKVGVSGRPPETGESDGEWGEPEGVAIADESAPPPLEDVTIAVFFPDGSAVSAGPVYITAGTLAAAGTVNRWTGSVVFKALDPEGATGGEGHEPVEDAPEAPRRDEGAGVAGEESP